MGSVRTARVRKRSLFFTALPGALSLAALLEGAPPGARAGDVYAVGGFTASTLEAHVFQGFIYTPFNGIGESGPVARLWLDSSWFQYHTNTRYNPDITVNVLGSGGAAEIGYQIVDGRARIAAFAGVAYRDYVLTPPDPRSELNERKVGVKLVAEGHAYPFASWGMSGYASYITGMQEYWVQARPGRRWASGLTLGIDTALWGGKDFQYARAGLFASGYEVDLFGAATIYVGGEGGVQMDTTTNKTAPFGGMHLGFFF